MLILSVSTGGFLLGKPASSSNYYPCGGGRRPAPGATGGTLLVGEACLRGMLATGEHPPPLEPGRCAVPTRRNDVEGAELKWSCLTVWNCQNPMAWDETVMVTGRRGVLLAYRRSSTRNTGGEALALAAAERGQSLFSYK